MWKQDTIHQAVFKRYEGFNILLQACQCRVTEESPAANGCRKYRWLAKEELKELQVLPPDEAVRVRLLQVEEGGYGI